MMTYEIEMKNFSKISITNGELLIEWDKGGESEIILKGETNGIC